MLILAGSILTVNANGQAQGTICAQPGPDNLFVLSNAQSRPTSPENRTALKKMEERLHPVTARSLHGNWPRGGKSIVECQNIPLVFKL